MLPLPVAAGTDHYYLDRLADFTRRWPTSDPPSYYEEYGDKCLHQFRRTQPRLTVQGQGWVQRTLVDLQQRMEQQRADDPAAFADLEHDSASFERAAFETHSDAYVASGIAHLPVRDLWKILRTPDVSDLVTADGVKEIFEVIEHAAIERGRSGPVAWVWARWLRLFCVPRPKMLTG